MSRLMARMLNRFRSRMPMSGGPLTCRSTASTRHAATGTHRSTNERLSKGWLVLPCPFLAKELSNYVLGTTDWYRTGGRIYVSGSPVQHHTGLVRLRSGGVGRGFRLPRYPEFRCIVPGTRADCGVGHACHVWRARADPPGR